MGYFDRFIKNNNKEQKKPVVALCLGGGGARGFAHIGAIKAFEEQGVDFDFCVGTSIGSLVGSIYCAGISSKEMEKYASSLDMKNVHNGIIITPNDASKIGKIVTDFIGDAKIESFPKKFAAVAVDLKEGKQVIIEKGSVALACSASSAIPLLFKPVKYNDKNLVDGGLINNIPADVCKMLGADKVVAIDVNPTRGKGTDGTGIFDVLKATLSIVLKNSSVAGLRSCDVLVSVNTQEFSSAKMNGYGEMLQRGYDETMKQMDEIKKLFIS